MEKAGLFNELQNPELSVRNDPINYLLRITNLASNGPQSNFIALGEGQLLHMLLVFRKAGQDLLALGTLKAH